MGNFRGGATAATKNAELGFLEALLSILWEGPRLEGETGLSESRKSELEITSQTQIFLTTEPSLESLFIFFLKNLKWKCYL